MSLIASASPWISENPSQKRQPTMNPKNKTMKKVTLPAPSTDPSSTAMSDTSLSSYGTSTLNSATDYVPTTATKSPSDSPGTDARQQRINELIQQMHQRQVDNDGQRLADFKPLTHPMVRTKKPEDTILGDAPTYIPNIMFSEGEAPSARSLSSPPPQPRMVQPSYSAHNADQAETHGYNTVYRPPPAITQAPYYQGKGGAPAGYVGAPVADTQKWSDKMNYIIHLLEDQVNEKTNTSMEEFVMFTMVGVFIIYVLDSFSRHGRYVR